MNHFETIEHLKNGTPKQLRAFSVLTQHHILENLSEYEPLLVGTIPLNIDIDSSDLDVICYWINKTAFINKVTNLFADKANFKIWANHQSDTVTANFTIDDFNIEVFGQSIPTKDQYAYRHMLIEHQILLQKGEAFRQEIIQLKNQGYKTEIAFGMLLGLNDNPYVQLLTYEIK